MKGKRNSLIIAFLLLFSFGIAQNFNFDNFFRRYTTREDVIGLLTTIKFSDKEITFLKSLDEKTLTKIIKIAELVYTSKKTTTSQDNNEKELLEKCAKEKASTGNYLNPDCKKLDPKALATAVGLASQDLLKKAELQAQNEALSDGHKDTPEFNSLVRQAREGNLPTYPDSVLNQTSLVGTPDFYDGKFVCNISNNGTFAGTERPRNQGGRVANSLFYAIANAAKASGAQVGSFGCYNPRNIAGTNTLSKHATGDACDVVLKGNDPRNTAFLVLFLANTGTHNTVGSYASRGFDHTHLGADCGGTWCPYQKGPGLEPWKELAFRAVFQACGQSFNPGSRPPKSYVQACAKKAAETFCK